MNQTVTTNPELKFNCPICAQHIAVAAEWGDWQINCPSCRTRITVPPRPKDNMKVKQALPPLTKTQAEGSEEFFDADQRVRELVT